MLMSNKLITNIIIITKTVLYLRYTENYFYIYNIMYIKLVDSTYTTDHCSLQYLYTIHYNIVMTNIIIYTLKQKDHEGSKDRKYNKQTKLHYTATSLRVIIIIYYNGSNAVYNFVLQDNYLPLNLSFKLIL